jgi:hypothetical protein
MKLIILKLHDQTQKSHPCYTYKPSVSRTIFSGFLYFLMPMKCFWSSYATTIKNATKYIGHIPWPLHCSLHTHTHTKTLTHAQAYTAVCVCVWGGGGCGCECVYACDPAPCQPVPIPFTILEISYFCCQINLKSGNRSTQPTHSFSVYEVVLSMRLHNQNHVLVSQRTHSPYLIIHVIILSILHRVLTDNVSIYIDWHSSIYPVCSLRRHFLSILHIHWKHGQEIFTVNFRPYNFTNRLWIKIILRRNELEPVE